MGSLVTQKPHAVLVPYPAQGHVNPFMQLAKLLHSKGFHITFVNTEFNYNRLIRSKGPDAVKGLDDFKFETISDGLPPSNPDATQDIWALCESTQKNCLVPFVELVRKLNASSDDDIPQVTCIISDGVMTFGVKAAEILGIPEVQFWTSSAPGFLSYLYFGEIVKRGIAPFKDESFTIDGTLDMPIDFIPGMPNLRLRDIPSFIRVTDPNDIMFNFLPQEALNNLNASAIIFNTFDELDFDVLETIKSKHYSRFFSVGPLCLLEKHVPDSKFKSLRSSLWKEDITCLDWLDKQEANSVVYVNYGSITVMTDQHLVEFAWGLANSNHPFLWIVRPDVVMGDSAILPKEFLEETKDRGLIASWCSQDKVLNHPSVGAFLTHCAWNSTVESISSGVPVICWPFFAEQQTNRYYACNVWKMGMEVNDDVKRGEVESLVREMMEGDKGKEMRKEAQKWKKKAVESTDIGGSSYNNFDILIKEVLLCSK